MLQRRFDVGVGQSPSGFVLFEPGAHQFYAVAHLHQHCGGEFAGFNVDAVTGKARSAYRGTTDAVGAADKAAATAADLLLS